MMLFIIADVFLGWVCHIAVQHVSRKEGGMQALAGLAPSCQTVGSVWITPRLAMPARKKSKKSEFNEFNSMKNALNDFSLNVFGKVKNLTNLHTTLDIT